ncbi:MAG TPA: hypothetical protein VGW58_08800, partial [Pyrinomonadaceae bacterium]|nr:hypothetical protein [Pyrinomonadaceae bacterium]
CFGSLSQSNRRDDPPPPSDEYFLRTWVEYSAPSGKYKIKFPKTPREYSEIQEGIGGQSTVYVAEYKGVLLYVTTYGDSPSHISDAKIFLSNISKAWLEANAARKLQVIKNEEVSLGGYQARFLQIETQQDVVRVRWIVVKDRVYYQFVAAPKHRNALESENGYHKLAMGFLDSFELTK